MQLSEAFLSLGEDVFSQLIGQISIGKLKTYQLYEPLKTRAHLSKLNSETLRKSTPRLWARLKENDPDFTRDLAQAVLVTHLDLIVDVLNFLGIPNENGFFQKDLDAAPYLTDGWQQRVFEQFRSKYPEPVLRLYINHLIWELVKDADMFVPAQQ